METQYVGGIEGGGTWCKMVLMTTDGKVLAESEGPATNQWMVGLDVCAERYNALVEDCKQKAGLPSDTCLGSLGISMSGGDSLKAREAVENKLKEKFSNLSHSYTVASDTVAPIATAFPLGGIVLIAGTGSNCEVLNPDGSVHRVGGWGHLVGDEGSACWVSLYCLKKLLDVEDNMEANPCNITRLKETIFQYFQIDNKMDLLPFLYQNFQKPKIAGLCKEIARVADEGDRVCQEVFYATGHILARHVVSIAPKVAKALFEQPGGLHVLCVGSVWKSWHLMKDGFIKGLEPRNEQDVRISEITLTELIKPATYGATIIGAKAAGISLAPNYDINAKSFFQQVL